MRYSEIITEQVIQEDDSDSLTGIILDLLTPIAANGITFVTIDQLIKKLQTIPTGFLVDREMLMAVLNPNRFPLVKSIEGDKLYLKVIAPPARSVSDDQKEKEQDQITDTATKQAIKNLKK